MYIIKGETDRQPRLDAWDKCSGLVHWENPEGWGFFPPQEGGSGWGTHVNPWLIHVNVWQKPLQYCKVISLQLIKHFPKQYSANYLLAEKWAFIKKEKAPKNYLQVMNWKYYPDTSRRTNKLSLFLFPRNDVKCRDKCVLFCFYRLMQCQEKRFIWTFLKSKDSSVRSTNQAEEHWFSF